MSAFGHTSPSGGGGLADQSDRCRDQPPLALPRYLDRSRLRLTTWCQKPSKCSVYQASFLSPRHHLLWFPSLPQSLCSIIASEYNRNGTRLDVNQRRRAHWRSRRWLKLKMISLTNVDAAREEMQNDSGVRSDIYLCSNRPASLRNNTTEDNGAMYHRFITHSSLPPVKI
jgi:hypothetical protein